MISNQQSVQSLLCEFTFSDREEMPEPWLPAPHHIGAPKEEVEGPGASGHGRDPDLDRY